MKKKKRKTNLLSKAWKVARVKSKTNKIRKLESKLKQLKRQRLSEFKKALKHLKNH